MAAYPITPATEMLEWMAPALTKVGGTLLQAEDELASINMIIGGAYGGVPSLTATAGPGLALMAEGIGLAVASETPVVIVDVMRGGSSTGIPAKTEQSDLSRPAGAAGELSPPRPAATAAGRAASRAHRLERREEGRRVNDIGTQAAALAPAAFKSAIKPIWCPGCGDYSVLSAITKALAMIGRPPHEVAVVSGIGCSSRIPAYTSCYGFHGVHGRALAVARD